MNKNDVVYTPRHISKAIIEYYDPQGKYLDPCRGNGAFYDYVNCDKDYCEIHDGKDFFAYNSRVDWIISNPPFSIYDEFLKKSFEVADNVVYLIPLYKVFKSNRYFDMVNKYGGIREVLIIGSGSVCNFNMGFLVGMCYYKRGYSGDCKISNFAALKLRGER